MRAANNAVAMGESNGDQDASLALARQFARRARELSAGDWELQFQNLEANLLYHRAEFSACLAVVDAIDQSASTLRTSTFSMQTRAQCYVDLGLLDEAEQIVQGYAGTDYDASEGSDLYLRAMIALWRGDPAAAVAITDENTLEGTTMWPYVAVVRSWAAVELGRPVDVDLDDVVVLPITAPIVTEVDALRVLADDPARSARLFSEAAESCRARSVPHAIRQTWAAAEAERRAGGRGAIAGLLAIEEEALTLGMAPIVSRARRSLRLAGVPRGAERGIDRTGLVTTREREVLDLVARGLSNAEIAGRLGVSRPTVRRILDNARAKLGARDRVEAAAMLAAASR
jgi:DNA-binding CsgD family transcriptional regulator